jgi:hypothetical protein
MRATCSGAGKKYDSRPVVGSVPDVPNLLKSVGHV